MHVLTVSDLCEIKYVWLVNDDVYRLVFLCKSFTAYDIKVFDTSDEESLASFNLSSSVDDVLTLALKLFITTISHDQPFLEVTTDSGSFFVAIDALNNIQVTFDR